LDSIFRKTDAECKVVLIDNASPDPMVKEIIKGFKRRSLFHEVHCMEDNKRANVIDTMKKYESELGDCFFRIESDVEILTDKWMDIMLEYFTEDYAFMGSAIDRSDFINPSTIKDTKENRFLTKWTSGERKRKIEGEGVLDMIPAGRLTLNRTELLFPALANNKEMYNDTTFGKFIRKKGYKAGIVKEVRHRHLSLLNYYDYSDYAFDNRMGFFQS
jgi:hypothetical protein